MNTSNPVRINDDYVNYEMNRMPEYNKRKFYLFEKIVLFFIYTYNLYIYIILIVIIFYIYLKIFKFFKFFLFIFK